MQNRFRRLIDLLERMEEMGGLDADEMKELIGLMEEKAEVLKDSYGAQMQGD